LKVEEYGGFDQIHVNNGTKLSIKHIGTAQISTPSLQFKLHNVLHVLQIRKNLLSIHQFTKAIKTLSFSHINFFVKDQAIGNTLLPGRSNHGLYIIHPFSYVNKSRDPTTLVGECASMPSWHSHLGHLAFSVVHRVLSSFKLPFL
jgi:hypothetical protein